MERGQRVCLGDERFNVEPAVSDCRNRLRIAVRSEVAPVNVQLFCIADDGPVDGYRLIEDTELDEGAEFPDHLQTKRYSGRVASGLDEDITAVAVGEILHPLHGIL